MNIGFPGEGFPYTNFHDMNLDWMIKIAKDFLDQYTHIQEVIAQGLVDLQDKTDTGLDALQEKYETLEGLLQDWYNEHSEDIAGQLADALEDLNAWYNEHSEDIAGQLADAISDFDLHADQKAEQAIATIPSDYTELNNRVLDLEFEGEDIYKWIDKGPSFNPDLHWYQQLCSGDDGSVTYSAAQIRSQIFYVGKGNYVRLVPDSGYLTHVRWYSSKALTSFVSSTNNLNGWILAPQDWLIVAFTTSDYANITVSAAEHVTISVYPFSNYPLEGTIYTVPDSSNPQTSVNVDLNTRTITFGNATSGTGRVYLRTGRESIQVGTKTVVFDTPFAFIYYRRSTEEFVSIEAGANDVRALSNDYVYIGSIWAQNSHTCVNLNVIPFYYVNGALTYPDDKRGTFDTLRSYGYSDYNMAVLGDSVSTFDGVSEDTIGGRQVRGPYYPHASLENQSQMWWYKLRNMLRFGGALNVSAISRSRYLNNIDVEGIYAPALWNNERIARLHLNSNYPHYIFIMAGINDGYSSNKYGEFSYANQIINIEEEQESIARGIELTIRKVQETNPYARIVLIIPYNIKLNTQDFNWKSYYKLAELLDQIGKAYGVYRIVDLRKSGLTEGNISTYTFDGIHLNEDGMDFIATYIYNCLTDDHQALRK